MEQRPACAGHDECKGYLAEDQALMHSICTITDLLELLQNQAQRGGLLPSCLGHARLCGQAIFHHMREVQQRVICKYIDPYADHSGESGHVECVKGTPDSVLPVVELYVGYFRRPNGVVKRYTDATSECMPLAWPLGYMAVRQLTSYQGPRAARCLSHCTSANVAACAGPGVLINFARLGYGTAGPKRLCWDPHIVRKVWFVW